jgi:hypothetical protein
MKALDAAVKIIDELAFPIDINDRGALMNIITSCIGRAVQVDPMKLTSKAPGTERLTLKYDGLLSTFAFKFKLRRFTSAPSTRAALGRSWRSLRWRQGLTLVHFSAQLERFVWDRGCT